MDATCSLQLCGFHALSCESQTQSDRQKIQSVFTLGLCQNLNGSNPNTKRHFENIWRESVPGRPSPLIGRLALKVNQASEGWTATGCDDTSPGAHSARSLTPLLRPPPLDGINQWGDHQEWRSAPGEPRNPSVAVPNPRGGDGGDRHFILCPSPPAFGWELSSYCTPCQLSTGILWYLITAWL